MIEYVWFGEQSKLRDVHLQHCKNSKDLSGVMGDRKKKQINQGKSS